VSAQVISPFSNIAIAVTAADYETASQQPKKEHPEKLPCKQWWLSSIASLCALEQWALGDNLHTAMLAAKLIGSGTNLRWCAQETSRP